MLRIGAGPAAAAMTMLLMVVLTTSATAQDPPTQAREYEIKAVFLHKLLLFVGEDPSTSSTDSTICILGQDPFAKAFADIEDKPEGPAGRWLRVRRIRRLKQTTDLSGCNILFISSSEKDQLGEILMGIENAPTLTVADMDEFLEYGGMVQLFIRGERENGYNLAFGINLIAIEKAGIELDPRFLDLADEVIPVPLSKNVSTSSQRATGKDW